MMYVQSVSALLLLLVVTFPTCAAWVVMPNASPRTGSLQMNIFGDFFKMPSYKPKEPEKPEEKEEEKAPEAAAVPNVQTLEEQKEQLAEHEEQTKAVVEESSVETVVDPPKAVVTESTSTAPMEEAAPVAAAADTAKGGQVEGTVEWFSIFKGYGFIRPVGKDEGDDSDNIFVHQTAISMDGFRKLRQGQLVRYTVEHDDNGRTRAVDVSLVKS